MAKLQAYEFWEESLLLIKGYLIYLWQRTNVSINLINLIN